jgi:hypothetical protein
MPKRGLNQYHPYPKKKVTQKTTPPTRILLSLKDYITLAKNKAHSIIKIYFPNWSLVVLQSFYKKYEWGASFYILTTSQQQVCFGFDFCKEGEGGEGLKRRQSVSARINSESHGYTNEPNNVCFCGDFHIDQSGDLYPLLALHHQQPHISQSSSLQHKSVPPSSQNDMSMLSPIPADFDMSLLPPLPSDFTFPPPSTLPKIPDDFDMSLLPPLPPNFNINFPPILPTIPDDFDMSKLPPLPQNFTPFNFSSPSPNSKYCKYHQAQKPQDILYHMSQIFEQLNQLVLGHIKNQLAIVEGFWKRIWNVYLIRLSCE